ncbi:hypothetical protein ABID46_000185 [Moheibacter stercoris]|uniref:Uncharacterized protein n=1 Tax=Moheibacter stercoris TaxID=1628251 RepID=A0ABV2LPX5_9FLAO
MVFLPYSAMEYYTIIGFVFITSRWVNWLISSVFFSLESILTDIPPMSFSILLNVTISFSRSIK